MKVLTFDDMIEQVDPRYGIPSVNIDDIKKLELEFKQLQKDVSDKLDILISEFKK